MIKKSIIIAAAIFLCCLPPVSANAARYVSLAPATTEILFALGLNDSIVGDTIFCNYPPEARSVQKIGTFSDPNIEQIISLKPDIVFATGLEQSPAVTKLRALGLKVIVSDPKNISGLFDSITEIGRAIENAAKEGDGREIREQLSRLQYYLDNVEVIFQA